MRFRPRRPRPTRRAGGRRQRLRQHPAPSRLAHHRRARALEQVVAELLEPVIRQWLHSNLPRLIEKAVREEVVRALAAERDAAKG